MSHWLTGLAEVVRHRPLQAPAAIGAMASARALGHPAHIFFLYSFHERPSSTWKDYRRQAELKRVFRALGNARSASISIDKLLSTARARQHGIAVVPILAVTGRNVAVRPAPDGFTLLPDRAAVAAMLDAPSLPDHLFAKPVRGEGGKGARLLLRVGDGWDVGGRNCTANALAAELVASPREAGMLVQPVLTNHPALAPVLGGRGLSTVRVLVALTDQGPRPFAAIQKIIVGDDITDNFHNAGAGNLIAAIDLGSGVLGAAHGRVPGARFLMDRFTHHPATGRALAGFVMPFWPETMALAAATAVAFPEFPLLGLDVAITADGPLLVETNAGWDLALPQVALGEGIAVTLAPLLPVLAVPEERRRAAIAALG